MEEGLESEATARQKNGLTAEEEPQPTSSSLKRVRSSPPSHPSLSEASEEKSSLSPSRKRLRVDESSSLTSTSAPTSSLCNAPKPTNLDLIRRAEGEKITEGDIFLSEGWRERWCRCSEVSYSRNPHRHAGWFKRKNLIKTDNSVCHNSRRSPILCVNSSYTSHPRILTLVRKPYPNFGASSLTKGYLLAWHEIPYNADFGGLIEFSLEELGMRALEKLPRDKALDGIRAFNEMRYVSISSPLIEHEP